MHQSAQKIERREEYPREYQKMERNLSEVREKRDRERDYAREKDYNYVREREPAGQNPER